MASEKDRRGDRDEGAIKRDFAVDYGSMPIHFLAQGNDPPVIMIPEPAGGDVSEAVPDVIHEAVHEAISDLVCEAASEVVVPTAPCGVIAEGNPRMDRGADRGVAAEVAVVVSEVSGEAKNVERPEELIDDAQVLNAGPSGTSHAQPQHECPMCGYSSANARQFLTHVRTVHNERMQIYDCPQCTYATRHSQKMYRHMSFVHDPHRTGRRPGPPPRLREDYYNEFAKEMHKRQTDRMRRRQEKHILQQEQNVAAAARAVALASAASAKTGVVQADRNSQTPPADARASGPYPRVGVIISTGNANKHGGPDHGPTGKKARPPTATVTLRDLALQRQRQQWEEEEQHQRLLELQRRLKHYRRQDQQQQDADDSDEDRLVIDNDDDDTEYVSGDAEDQQGRRTSPPRPRSGSVATGNTDNEENAVPSSLLQQQQTDQHPLRVQFQQDEEGGGVGVDLQSREPRMDFDPVTSTFKCAACDFVSRTPSLVARHESVVHGTKDRRTFRCDKCGYSTPLRSRFNKHLRYHDQPMMKCLECDFGSPYQWNLDRHIAHHDTDNRKKFGCVACSFSTNVRQTLSVHEATHHVPPVPHTHKRHPKHPKPAAGVAAMVASAALAASAAMRKQVTRDKNPATANGLDKKIHVTGRRHRPTLSAPVNMFEPAVGAATATASPPAIDADGDTTSVAVAASYCGPSSIADAPTSPPTTPSTPSPSSAVAVPGVRLPSHQALRCSLCNFRSPVFAAMSRHMVTSHPHSKPVRPPPSLTPSPAAQSQGPLPAKRPAKPLPNLIPIQATTIGQGQGRITPTTPIPTPANDEDANEAAKKKNSFFDQLRLYPGSAAGDGSELVCVHCGHEAKTLSELVRHNKLHQGSSRAQGTSTRCQHCRHRCKTSSDLKQHLRTCPKAIAAVGTPAAPGAPAVVPVTPGVAESPLPVRPLDGLVDDSTRLTTDSEMEYATSVAEVNAEANNAFNGNATVADDADDNHLFPADTEIAEAEASMVGVETAPGYGLVTKLTDLEARATKENVPTPPTSAKKVFKCAHCPFWAATASRFHVHMVGHLNKKPFACSICKYRSNWRWDITKHIKKQILDPSHAEAKILMTDETGRRDYSKYNKHLLWLKCAEPASTPEIVFPVACSTKPAINGTQVNPATSEHSLVLPAPPKLTRAPTPRVNIKIQPSIPGTLLRPPPPLQAAVPQSSSQLIIVPAGMRAVQQNQSLPQQQQQLQPAPHPQQLPLKRPADSPVPQVGADPKKSNTEIKKTVWRCKQCHFRDGDRAVVLAHVKGHYRQQQEAAMAKLKNSSGGPVAQSQSPQESNVSVIKKVPFRCDVCPFVSVSETVIQSHMNCHKERNDVFFKCFYCPFYVSTKEEVIQHMSVHQQNPKSESTNSPPGKVSPKRNATPTSSQPPPSNQAVINKKETVSSTKSKKETVKKQQDLSLNANQQRQSSHQQPIPPLLDFSKMTEAPLCWVLKEDKLQKMLRCRFCPHVNLRRANMHEHEKMHLKRASLPPGETSEGSSQYSPYPCSECSYISNNAGVLSTHMKVHNAFGYPQACGFYDPYRSESVQLREIVERCNLKIDIDDITLQKSSPPKEASDLSNEHKLSGINVMSLLDPNQSLTDAVLAMKKKFNLELDGEPFAEPVEDSAESPPCSPLKQLNEGTDPTASDAHDEKQLYFCRQCPARFLFRKELGIHSRFHNLYLVHKCDNCTYTARQRSHLQSHFKVHTDEYKERTSSLMRLYKVNTEFPMPRTVCVNHKAGAPGNLWIVIEVSESPPPEPKFVCQKCPASFFKTEAFQAHLTLHGSNNPHKCRICDYAVKTYGNLIKHMISHGCRASVAKKILQGRMEVPESLLPKTALLHQNEASSQQLLVPKEESQSSDDIDSLRGNENVDMIPQGVEVKKDTSMEVDSEQEADHAEKCDDEAKDKENCPSKTASSAKNSGFGSGSPEFVYPTFCRNGRIKVKRFKCQKCPSAFEKRDQYVVHMNLHGSKQRYKCTKCDYSVKFVANHIQHLRRHQLSEEARNNGKDDSESSTNEGEETIPEDTENIPSSSPTRPAKTTGGKREKLSVADQQAIMVLQQRRAKRAAVSREALDKNYWCSHCPYSSPRRDQVESHMKRHIAVSGIRNAFLCDHCDYSVPIKHFLRDHSKLHFDVSKTPRPDAFMICDGLEVYSSSGFVGRNRSKGKMLIFQDKGSNVTTDRFVPLLPSETSDDSNDSAARLYINPKTFESESSHETGNKESADTSAENESTSESERDTDVRQNEKSIGKESSKSSPGSPSTVNEFSESDLTRTNSPGSSLVMDSSC